jgi:hypothetical protein
MKLFAHSRLVEPKRHKYVGLIEFALTNPEFSTREACGATGLSDKEFRFVADTIFSLNANQTQWTYQPSQKQEWILKPEAYFSYLQFLEFRHSIEHARRAYWLSVFAIIVSTIGVGIALK